MVEPVDSPENLEQQIYDACSKMKENALELNQTAKSEFGGGRR